LAVDPIPVQYVEIALDRVGGAEFERFVNSYFPPLAGVTFVPLGGNKDGGADAFDGGIWSAAGKAESFYQASIEQDTEAKIRRTIARLREFGRTPGRLTYITSQTVKFIDEVESRLTKDLDATITVRDGAYIASHINDGPATRGAFDQHLRHHIDALKHVGASQLITASKHVKSPAVYVFLAQELDRRQGDESLVDSVTDALILWALEGTDPDTDDLLSHDEVSQRIMTQLPSVKALVEPRLRARLEAMAAKGYASGRAVRWHKKEDLFCLPYETRQQIELETVADEALRIQVLNGFEDRLRAERIEGLGEAEIHTASEVALRSLQLAFEHEGLEFASFLEAGETEYTTISDSIKAALIEAHVSGKRGLRIGEAAFTVIRSVFYDSHESERLYLSKLSRTYALLFTLNTEPRLIEFFQDMVGEFQLYVGADQIVRALSEQYLAAADQMTRNTLLMAARNGAKLILTEPVLDEVVHHFRACDTEYQSAVAAVEHHLTYELARIAPHIMLRSYLYARLSTTLGKRHPRNWPAFVQQFVGHAELWKPDAYVQLRRYLQSSFAMSYESTADLEALVDVEQVKSLAGKLNASKKDPQLARNDALMALAVYGSRQDRNEEAKVSEFGYETWWLTGETSIIKHTRDVVTAHSGARYMMRPDFLLNFLTLAPSAREAREAFAAVFPTLLGIKLANRMKPETFHKIMAKVAEAECLDDARRMSAIASITDKLKGDLVRQYARVGGTGVDAHHAPVDVATAAIHSEN
jgi:hypothetical protein